MSETVSKAAASSALDRIRARTREEDEDNIPFDSDVVIDALMRLASREMEFAAKCRARIEGLAEQSREAQATAENADARLKRLLEALDLRQI